tara:strand:- start:857 stop:1402 length:546 start_codon:yes stop_codon:yes gene_type:complete
MLKKLLVCLFILTNSNHVKSSGYDVFSYGYFDYVRWFNDGPKADEAYDFRYERRFGNSVFDIGPESENFFYLKPFAGIELTSDSASYLIGGVYLEDNLGTLFVGKKSNFLLTPSVGVGLYDDGSGKKMGNIIQFRTTIELSYELESKNRIGISLGHISNGNIGHVNPGSEILNFSYQIPFN